jgi:arylformamidase
MIHDFDDAYSNMAYIPRGSAYPDTWAARAATFRGTQPAAKLDVPYGNRVRQKVDVFEPEGPSRGLAIFVHGGYWMRFGKADWSHLARGALARGWTVAMPGYTLTPQVRITDIVTEIAMAISKLAATYQGPIRLAGHSAGGHLVCRQVCTDTRLTEPVLARITGVLSISGLYDLRPLLQTKMNETLMLDEEEACAQSPALLRPISGIPVSCWVGADERPEFLRQNDLLANVWRGLGINTDSHHANARHHFNVIDDLMSPNSELCQLWAG